MPGSGASRGDGGLEGGHLFPRGLGLISLGMVFQHQPVGLQGPSGVVISGRQQLGEVHQGVVRQRIAGKDLREAAEPRHRAAEILPILAGAPGLLVGQGRAVKRIGPPPGLGDSSVNGLEAPGDAAPNGRVGSRGFGRPVKRGGGPLVFDAVVGRPERARGDHEKGQQHGAGHQRPDPGLAAEASGWIPARSRIHNSPFSSRDLA